MNSNKVIVLLAVLIVSCDIGGEPPDETPAFALYLPADPDLKVDSILLADPRTIALRDRPLLQAQDVRFYDYSAHCLYLKRSQRDILPYEQAGHPFFTSSWCNRPFIMQADGESRYIGYFHCGLLFDLWPVPSISDLENNRYPDDVLCIDWDWFFLSEQDTRFDDMVREAIVSEGLFHGGLSLRLDAVSVPVNADTATVRYTFTLTNEDRDDLLVLDPDKRGSSLFHYFMNGIVLQHLGTGLVYRDDLKVFESIPELGYWSPAWFTRIPSGGSMQRQVDLKGYARFPAGDYRYQFNFMNPRYIDASANIVDGGRYWLGEIPSNTGVLHVVE